MLNRKLSDGSSFCELIEFEPSVRSSIEHLLDPAVPVLPQTVLFLELLLDEPSIDLAAISQLILEDVGATLQILRLAAREFGRADCPLRIQDCIASLGVRVCLDALSMRTARYDDRYHVVAESWNHSRQIAEFCRLLAEDSQKISPENAYLIGLLHEVGSLPAILGWRQPGRDLGDATLAGSRLVKKWSFPAFIADSLEEASAHDQPSEWSNLLRNAHHLAALSAGQERLRLM